VIVTVEVWLGVRDGGMGVVVFGIVVNVFGMVVFVRVDWAEKLKVLQAVRDMLRRKRKNGIKIATIFIFCCWIKLEFFQDPKILSMGHLLSLFSSNCL